MTTYTRTLAIVVAFAAAFSAYGAETNRNPPKQTTVPGVSAPVVPPTTAAVPPIAPVTPVPQAVVPPTQTTIVPTAPATIPQPQGNAVQGTTPPQ